MKLPLNIDVQQILLYMESIQNPANFRKLATRITKKKPVLALKAGRSAAGASAALQYLHPSVAPVQPHAPYSPGKHDA